VTTLVAGQHPPLGLMAATRATAPESVLLCETPGGLDHNSGGKLTQRAVGSAGNGAPF